MPVLRNARRLYRCAEGGGQGELHAVDDGALAWSEADGVIAFAGPEAELPTEWSGEPEVDAGGALVFPGLVDCHTHLPFAGSRLDEMEHRLRGGDYLEILRQGGGIQRTVRATREAGEEELVRLSRERLRAMLRQGVTTVEAKSGYGLDTDHELEQLRVVARLAHDDDPPVRLVPTFLGAHVVPWELRDDRQRYLDLLHDEMLPTVAEARLARFFDVFVEEGAFSADEARRLCARAAEVGLGSKLHVDQLHDMDGGALAVEVGAVSADHLEHLSPEGVAALAEAAATGPVAVSLPFATLFLRQPPMPARALVEAGVAVAVATDFNPGSAPSHHLPVALGLACALQGMTAAEAIKGATIYAARAIGEEERVGSLEPGKLADFLLVDAADELEWIYTFPENAVRAVWIGGRRAVP